MLLFLALLSLTQPEGMTRITVTGREMVGLRDRVDVIRGTCDRRPVSAIITKNYWGARGRVVLRAGQWRREVPPTFLNGSLLSSGLKSAELESRLPRVQLHALAIRENAHGEFVMEIQNAVLDMRTGALSIDEMRTLSPAETRSENAPNR